MKDVIILYAAGKIKKDEIPLECFANYDTRSSFVPQDLVDEFDKKLAEIGEEFTSKKEQSLEKKTAQHEENKSKAKDKIMEMGW